MKNYLGAWIFLYLIIALFIYNWIDKWRYRVECLSGPSILMDCKPDTRGIMLLLFLIIPTIGLIISSFYWERQHSVSRILYVVSVILIISFLILYLYSLSSLRVRGF